MGSLGWPCFAEGRWSIHYSMFCHFESSRSGFQGRVEYLCCCPSLGSLNYGLSSSFLVLAPWVLMWKWYLRNCFLSHQRSHHIAWLLEILRDSNGHVACNLCFFWCDQALALTAPWWWVALWAGCLIVASTMALTWVCRCCWSMYLMLAASRNALRHRILDRWGLVGCLCCVWSSSPASQIPWSCWHGCHLVARCRLDTLWKALVACCLFAALADQSQQLHLLDSIVHYSTLLPILQESAPYSWAFQWATAIWWLHPWPQSLQEWCLVCYWPQPCAAYTWSAPSFLFVLPSISIWFGKTWRQSLSFLILMLEYSPGFWYLNLVCQHRRCQPPLGRVFASAVLFAQSGTRRSASRSGSVLSTSKGDENAIQFWFWISCAMCP